VELYYQYRINRRWFAYTSWQGEIRYWQQQQDNVSFQLASSTQIEHQLALGIGLNF
jgi:hypothetical protein